MANRIFCSSDKNVKLLTPVKWYRVLEDNDIRQLRAIFPLINIDCFGFRSVESLSDQKIFNLIHEKCRIDELFIQIDRPCPLISDIFGEIYSSPCRVKVDNKSVFNYEYKSVQKIVPNKYRKHIKEIYIYTTVKHNRGMSWDEPTLVVLEKYPKGNDIWKKRKNVTTIMESQKPIKCSRQEEIITYNYYKNMFDYMEMFHTFIFLSQLSNFITDDIQKYTKQICIERSNFSGIKYSK